MFFKCKLFCKASSSGCNVSLWLIINVVFCCCRKSASGFHVLCMLRCFFAHHRCEERTRYDSLPASSFKSNQSPMTLSHQQVPEEKDVFWGFCTPNPRRSTQGCLEPTAISRSNVFLVNINWSGAVWFYALNCFHVIGRMDHCINKQVFLIKWLVSVSCFLFCFSGCHFKRKHHICVGLW